MKSKVVVLLSESSCGKDYISNQLKEKYGWHFALSYTTRPKRKNEENFREYIFLNSNEEFLDLYDRGEMFEFTTYEPKDSLWYYGVGEKSFRDDIVNILILNPDGYRQLQESKLKDRLEVFKIDCPFEQRFFRYLNRDEINDTEKIELVDRFVRDKEDFKDFVKNNHCHVLKNPDGQNIDLLCRLIKNIVEGE